MHRPGVLTEGLLQRPLPLLGQIEQQGKHNVLQVQTPSVRLERPQLQTRQSLWLHNWYNPPWIQQELRRRSQIESCPVPKGDQDCTALLNLIKACGKKKDLYKGSRLHAHTLETGLLKNNIYIGTALLRMYAKCGALTKAQEVFDELPVQDAVSWTALISGYTEHGLCEEALSCFARMQDEGVFPDAISFVCILKACGNLGATKKGEEMHVELRKLGLLDNNDIVLRTALVDMYAKCGVLAKAQEVFDELSRRDAVSWTALIAGYAQQGLGEEALNCFVRMQDEGFSPDTATFVCLLKACGSIGAIKKGEEIHAEVQKQGLLENHDVVLGNALVDMYGKCGALAKAQEVFDGLLVQNVVSWTSLISGYVQHGNNDGAINCFEQMIDEGVSPTATTFGFILKACGSIGAIRKGEEIHAEVRRLGLLENDDIMLATALIDMYAKCGVLAKAQEVLDELPVRSAVSWTALITGYAQHGLGGEALECFEQMQDEGFSPDAVTFACILKACGSTRAIEKGKEIHAEVNRLGLLDNNDIVLHTALVDMYAKCGVLAKAQEVFDELSTQDEVSWNALIAGYAQHGFGEEVLNCFDQMRDHGFSPGAITFLSALKACGSIGAIEKGQEIHAEVCRRGLLDTHDGSLGSALVDMYARCGALTKAQEVFDELPIRNLASWNALLTGYARLGKAKRVFNLFNKMRAENIEPDGITFIILLTACSHAGLVEEGNMCFDIMSTIYCIIPTLEHHTCMVDLYSRAGHFDTARNVIENASDSDLSFTLLGACQNGVNVELGEWAFKHALQLDDKIAPTYFSMSNTCEHATGSGQIEVFQDRKWRMYR